MNLVYFQQKVIHAVFHEIPWAGLHQDVPHGRLRRLQVRRLEGDYSPGLPAPSRATGSPPDFSSCLNNSTNCFSHHTAVEILVTQNPQFNELNLGFAVPSFVFCVPVPLCWSTTTPRLASSSTTPPAPSSPTPGTRVRYVSASTGPLHRRGPRWSGTTTTTPSLPPPRSGILPHLPSTLHFHTFAVIRLRRLW